MFQTSKTLNGSNLFFHYVFEATVLNVLNVAIDIDCAEWDGPLHSHNIGDKPGQARRFPGAIQGDTCILACLSLYLTCSF